MTLLFPLLSLILGYYFSFSLSVQPPLPVTTNFTVTYADNSSVHIYMVGDPTGCIFRIVNVPPGNNATPPSFLRYPLEDTANIPPIPSNAGFTVVDVGDGYVLTASSSIIYVNKTVPLTTVTRPDGTIVSQEIQPVSREVPSQCGNGHGGPISTGCLRAWRTLTYREQIYGFGDQFTNLNHAGTTKFIRTCANPDSTGLTHAPMPFFLSSRGYGIALNTHVYSYFDIGFAFPPNPSTTGIHLMHTADPVMDMYFFMGPDPKAILNQFTLIYGRTAMPPKWSLKLWYHPQEQSNQSQIINVVNNFTNNNIPLAAVTLEPPYQTHAYSCTYVWNPKQIWDPAGMVATLNASGVVTTLWQHAYIYNQSQGLASPLWDPVYTAGYAADWITWGGATPDWTLNGTRNAVQSYMQQTFLDIGIAAFKLDECDGTPPNTSNDWFFQDTSEFPSGFDGMHMHNLFGLLYGFTYHNLFENNNLRTFLKARATYMGGQRYPTTMYSDSYDYNQYILAVINSGWSGITWAPELRDASNNTEFIRRSQLMLFAGIASEDGWNTGFQPYPPFVSGTAAGIYQYYYNARMELVPTLYNAWMVQNSNGYPVVHSLIMDYPNDSLTLSTIADEYSLAGLLVAPCPLYDTTRNVYFPAGSGSWVNYFNASTSPVYNASDTVNVSCQDSDFPVFQQIGSLYALASLTDSQLLRVRGIADGSRPNNNQNSPLPSSTLMIYDDDGKTWNYKRQKEYYTAVTNFTLTTDSTKKWTFATQYTVQHNQYTPEWTRLGYEIVVPQNHPLRLETTTDAEMVNQEPLFNYGECITNAGNHDGTTTVPVTILPNNHVNMETMKAKLPYLTYDTVTSTLHFVLSLPMHESIVCRFSQA